MTNAQLIYMILDEVKANSDDSFVTEDHILFLAHKYRVMLLTKAYKDIKKEIPTSNYQTICLNLEQYKADDNPCSELYLRSIEKIPTVLPISNSQVYTDDYYQGNITYVSREKMKYVGYNKYLKNIIYASLGADNHIYLTSNNPQYKYLEKLKFTGIFENSDEAAELACDKESQCNPMERTFPIEDALVTTLIELVVKEVLGIEYKPQDIANNAKDDLNAMANANKQSQQ